jgi:hypothetical protein
MPITQPGLIPTIHRMRPARRRIITAKRLLGLAIVGAALAVAAWSLGRHIAARWIVERALGAAGLTPATFRIHSVGFGGLRLENLSAGATPTLTAETVDVRYSIGDLLSGRVRTIGVSGARWTVIMREGAVDWGTQAGASDGAPPALVLPFDRVELTDSVIRLVIDGTPLDVPINGHLGWAGPGAVSARVDLRGPAHWHAADLNAGLQWATASATVRAGGGGLSLADGVLSIRGGSVSAGDFMLSEARLDAVVRAPDALEITSLEAVIGDGGTIEAAPFTVDLRAPSVRTRMAVANMSLADWLPLITGDYATGQGRLSGYADFGMDWIGGRSRMTGLTGLLRADPQHGFIQVKDAEVVAGLLERQDPRFATDEAMRSVRDKIVAALQDFAFHTLSVDLSRRDRRTIALTRLSGFGRHGTDPQGINLTLDLQAEDAFIGLMSRLAARSKMRDAAAEALDRFFQDGATPRR